MAEGQLIIRLLQFLYYDQQEEKGTELNLSSTTKLHHPLALHSNDNNTMEQLSDSYIQELFFCLLVTE